MLITNAEAEDLAEQIGDLMARIDHLIAVPDEASEQQVIRDIDALNNQVYQMLEKQGHLPAWAKRRPLSD